MMLNLLRTFLLLALLFLQVGCATTESDLDYTREGPPPAQTDADHSYHGWNNANY